MINSVFAQWSASWSDVFYTCLGLRMENTDMNSHQLVGDHKSSRNYTDFKPSLTASINIPGKGNQSLRFSIDRYITRPYFSDLDPFVYWLSPDTYSVGNPDLKPSTSWYFTLNYSFFHNFNLALASEFQKNTYGNYIYTDGNGNTVSSTGNFGRTNRFRASFSYNKSIADVWYLRASAHAEYSSVEATLLNNDIGHNQWFYYFSIFNDFTLSEVHKCYLDVYYGYSSPLRLITSTFEKRNDLTVSVNKQFSKGLTISGEVMYLIGYENSSRYTSPEFSFYRKTNANQFIFSFRIKYTFGKPKIKKANDRRYDSPLDSRLQ